MNGGRRITGAGIVLGAIGAWLMSELITANLVEVGAFDPIVWMASPLLLLAASVACLVPAVRASRLDPAITLGAD